MEEKVLKTTEEEITKIVDEGNTLNNLEQLGDLVDIYKDIKEVKCMRYRKYEGYGNYNNYGNYGRDSYGREQYGEYNEYGRRGYDTKYRGHDHLDKMYGEYGRYEEGREEYNRGNYGAKEDTLKSLEYMLESAVDFFEMLKSEANSQEEIGLIRKYTKKISEM